MRHLTDFPTFGSWVEMIKDQHIWIVDGTTFPLTLLCLQQFIKPTAITLHLRSVPLVVAARVSFVMLVVNRSFAGAAIRLQPVRIARELMKLARVFRSFATETLLQHNSIPTVEL